jgi:lysophospholipase L1-like esterase
MFWREDLHLSVAGHRVIARAMVDRVAKLAGIGR